MNLAASSPAITFCSTTGRASRRRSSHRQTRDSRYWQYKPAEQTHDDSLVRGHAASSRILCRQDRCVGQSMLATHGETVDKLCATLRPKSRPRSARNSPRAGTIRFLLTIKTKQRSTGISRQRNHGLIRTTEAAAAENETSGRYARFRFSVSRIRRKEHARTARRRFSKSVERTTQSARQPRRRTSLSTRNRRSGRDDRGLRQRRVWSASG